MLNIEPLTISKHQQSCKQHPRMSHACTKPALLALEALSVFIARIKKSNNASLLRIL